MFYANNPQLITALSELRKVLFLALSDFFLFMYKGATTGRGGPNPKNLDRPPQLFT